MASQGKFLVSGGNDEEIRIYNIRRRFEVGSLMKHQAPITTLRFSKKANSLASGSDDGMIAVWRIKDWECVSFKPAHKGSVIDLDVHPSGKVMMSCGRDSTLRLWCMTSSKELYCRPQKGRGYGSFQQLRWRPKGEGFCYALANDVAICDTNSDDPVVRFSHPRPPFSFAFLSDNTVATGGEDKIVRVWDVRTGKLASEIPEFSSRIRALLVEPLTQSLCVLGCSLPPTPTTPDAAHPPLPPPLPPPCLLYPSFVCACSPRVRAGTLACFTLRLQGEKSALWGLSTRVCAA